MITYTAVYDLAVGPVSYDFAVWLVAADMERKKAGADHLHVLIVPKSDGVDGWFRDKTVLYDGDEMHWRLWHLVLPLCRLMRATVAMVPPVYSHAAHAAEQEQVISHHAGPIVTAVRGGASVSKFKAGKHAIKAVRAHIGNGAKTVTMTLRQTYDQHRNADRSQWLEAAKQIEARGFRVIVLNDTAVALSAGAGFYEVNVELRLALYEVAALNLHCNGGPQVLGWFSDAAWLAFDAAMPADMWGKHWESICA